MRPLATRLTNDKLDELLLQWEEVYEQGQNLPAEELCADCPELIPELQQRINALMKMEDRFGATGHMDSPQPSEGEAPQLNGAVDLTSAYTVLHQHATGGLGEIYLAHDSTLQREVAVKTLKDVCRQMPDRVARFLREARITGQLEHPGIVPVYGLGASGDGKPLYAMRFVRGVSLDEAIETAHIKGGRQSDLRPLLRHLVSACRTVHYAHSRKVLHCDIKPLNIMVGKFGETFVLDWGEAVVINPQTLATEGPVPAVRGLDSQTDSPGGGTVPYMAPERVDLSGTPLDITSDVYSLGATLYKVLTGRDAFRASTRQELVDKIRTGDYTLPRELNPQVPPALADVCAKALSLRREDRYQNAGDLADDIQAWMDDEPISLRRETWGEWLSRISRRHRAAALATLATLFAIILGTSALAVMSFSNARQRAEDLQTAEAFRQSGLKALTRFAALQIERDIEANWKILEEAARNEKLTEWINHVESTRERSTDLQNWLGELYAANRKVSSWFLLGATGNQLGRYPDGELTFGELRNFAYKAYFHGQGVEYDENSQHPPMRQPALSSVFWSSSDACRKIAYSVPVWGNSSDGKPIGVLVMTVKLGDIELIDIEVGGTPVRPSALTPRTHEDNHRHALLIDLRSDWNNHRGTVLQHPLFREERLDPDQTPLVPDATVHQLEGILQRASSRGIVPEILPDFRDPILDWSRQAAIAPVRVRNQNIGWFVVVTEPPSP